MPKKTRVKALDEQRKAGHFKWEFLRRNEAFKIALQKHLKKNEVLLDAWNQNLKKNNQDCAAKDLQAMVRADQAFITKWGLSSHGLRGYPDPNKTFEELSDDQKNMIQKSTTEPSLAHLRSFLVGKQGHEWFSEIILGKTYYSECVDIRKIELSIDLTKPKKHIIFEVTEIINLLKDYMESLYDDKENRQQIVKYEEYLKVYDLKEKKGLSWVEILREIDSNADSQIKRNGKVTATKQIRDAYKRCKEIIEKGYKNIC